VDRLEPPPEASPAPAGGQQQSFYGHEVLAAESFVDRQLFRGTGYQASGWTLLGPRAADDEVVAVDGKELLNSQGVEIVSAYAVRSGRPRQATQQGFPDAMSARNARKVSRSSPSPNRPGYPDEKSALESRAGKTRH
jgi:hypothetical protein